MVGAHPENREKGRNYQRHDVDFNPSGWPESNTYIEHFGPLWVKTPMLGTQLGSDFIPNNTITGSEHLNNSRPKGNAYDKKGLQYPESLATQYLDDQYNAQCPLYWSSITTRAKLADSKGFDTQCIHTNLNHFGGQ